ncbi:MAG: hypothetical protein Kow0069_27210 [Promethearchaeota archaeon]
MDPAELLAKPLDPTPGADVSVHRFAGVDVETFDLGGQENRRWLGEEQAVFDETDLVLCVLPFAAPTRK